MQAILGHRDQVNLASIWNQLHNLQTHRSSVHRRTRHLPESLNGESTAKCIHESFSIAIHI